MLTVTLGSKFRHVLFDGERDLKRGGQRLPLSALHNQQVVGRGGVAKREYTRCASQGPDE